MSAHDATDQMVDGKSRPYSIDLTLELEHQLENESNPPTSPTAAGRPQSLDPGVLASIVTQLRMSLVDVTKERDDIALLFSESRSREQGLQDTLEHMTEKYTKCRDELEAAQAKAKDDENAIALLRSKVEESRRGLMRLQAESRRMSQAPNALDMSRAGLPLLGGPPSSRRTSFAPLTGNNISSHRRISSVSDASFSLMDGSSQSGFLSPPPNATFTFSDNGTQQGQNHTPSTSRRMSALFTQSPYLDHNDESHTNTAALEALQRELKAVKAELEESRHELSESNEAREASETCVKALREFIEEHNVGQQSTVPDSSSIKAPPPMIPPGRTPSEVKRANTSAGGWGFKLWRAEPPVLAPSTPSSPATNRTLPTTPQPTAPLTRKFGDLFGSRAAASAPLPSTPVRHAQLRSEQEMMYHNASDTSSLADSVPEPISPPSELTSTSVLVLDQSTISSIDLNGSQDQFKKATDVHTSPLSMNSSLAPMAI